MRALLFPQRLTHYIELVGPRMQQTSIKNHKCLLQSRCKLLSMKKGKIRTEWWKIDEKWTKNKGSYEIWEFRKLKWGLRLCLSECLTFSELKSDFFFLQFLYKTNWELGYSEIVNSLICIFISIIRFFFFWGGWKFAKIPNFITFLYFVQISSNFQQICHSVLVFSLVIELT